MKTKQLLMTMGLIAVLLFAGCSPRARVGALRTETKSVELGDAQSVHVEINFGAGNLQVTGGAEKLLEAGFTYNVDRLKPEVKYTNGTLVVRQPNTNGLPVWKDITDFRNEWNLRLSDKVPVDLRVDMGAGSSDLRLAGLLLTGLDVQLGAGTYMVDLSGDWARNLSVSIKSGAANISVRLPRDVGVRVKVDDGPTIINANGLAQEENVYTNAAYGESPVTMQVEMEPGIGQINLEVEEAAETSTSSLR